MVAQAAMLSQSKFKHPRSIHLGDLTQKIVLKHPLLQTSIVAGVGLLAYSESKSSNTKADQNTEAISELRVEVSQLRQEIVRFGTKVEKSDAVNDQFHKV